MNYREAILAEKIDEYKIQHRIFYQSLSSMIFDIAFLQACVDLQDYDLSYDLITVKMLHRNIFENLISKVYRCFFDKTSGATNIIIFKSLVIGRYLKAEHRKEINDKVKELPIFSSEYKNNKFKDLEKNCRDLRHSFIGHRLLATEDNAIIDLDDIRKLVDYGCELFQVLSFEPSDFYSFLEGDGYDFSREKTFTDKHTRTFVNHILLTSRYIDKINCEINQSCPKNVKEKIQKVVSKANAYRE